MVGSSDWTDVPLTASSYKWINWNFSACFYYPCVRPP